MAVQKSRKSRSKRNMRRANDSVKSATLATDSVTGEIHQRHHVTASGMYRGKQMIAQAEVAEEDE